MKSIASALLVITHLALCASVGQAGDSSLPTTDSESSEVTALVALEKLLAENRKLRAEMDDARKLAAASTMRSRVNWTGCLLNRQIDCTVSSKSRQSLAREVRPLL